MTFMIRVLSVPGASVRRERFTRMAEAVKLPAWKFFDAVTPASNTFPYDDALARQASGRPLSPSELSCFASHVGIMEEFLADPAATHLLVLEDDIFSDPYFDFGTLPAFLDKSGIDHVKLYASFYVPSRLVGRLGRFSIYRGVWPTLGAQAYAMTRAGAEKMVKHMRAGPAVKPADDAMDDYVTSGIPTYLLYPFPVTELNAQSSISGRDGPADGGKRRSKLAQMVEYRMAQMKRMQANRSLFANDARIGSNLDRHAAELEPMLMGGNIEARYP